MNRTEKMVSMYRSGMTLAQIGDSFGLSRERIRQIVREGAQVPKESGGCFSRWTKRLEREKDRRAKRSDTILQRYGITAEEYDEFRSVFQSQLPFTKYRWQKQHADARGIQWQLTFRQWWEIWQQSGRWAERGKHGYCMARWGDTGGYSPENVYICTIGQNFSDSYLVKPWIERFGKHGPAGLTRNKKGVA